MRMLWGQLKSDVLGKTDHCRNLGAPDKHDRLKDCATRGEVNPIIVEAIELLRVL
jgi:hypothetical protein